MTNFARTPAPAAGHTRRLVPLFFLALLLASALCACLAAPAGAVVTEVAGTQVGVQPRSGGPSSLTFPSGSFSNENGNAVVPGSASVYAVYWDPGAWFHHEWLSNIDGFFQKLGESYYGTIFSAVSQYRDRSNSPAASHYTFKGAYSDTAPYPAEKCTDPEALEFGQITCVTDAQVREQLQSFIASHGTSKGMNAIYYVLTPPGVAVCLDEASTSCSDFKLTPKEVSEGVRNSASYENSFCSYHGAINPEKAPEGNANTILYGAIPWTAGYEGHPWDFVPGASNAGQAYDCQDGGWNSEKHEENFEKILPMTTAEEEHFEEALPEEKEAIKQARRLEGPHIQEPNQEGPGEEGDYAPALSDVLINQIAEEQANIVTDPLLTSWHNPISGREATDECRNVFAATASPSTLGGSVQADLATEAGTLYNEELAGQNYYINNIINNGQLHTNDCVGGLGLVPRFTSPNPVNSGELVDFDGMESTVSEFEAAIFGPTGPPSTTYATFKWNFGDGTPEVTGYAPGAVPDCQAPWLSPCAESIFHSYTYGGTYTVTLTVTDVGGNVATVSHEVTVVGPPPADPRRPGAPGGSGSSSGGASAAPAPAPDRAATAARAGRRPPRLRNSRCARALRQRCARPLLGQRAGRGALRGADLTQPLARRLKIRGTPATGLPAGTPPQVVIGTRPARDHEGRPQHGPDHALQEASPPGSSTRTARP